MATRRLQRELGELTSDPPPWLRCSIVGDNLFKWKATITGPEKTPYDKGIFNIELDIPQEYPFKPPKLKFVTKTYHPNIKQEDGSVCADILGEGWSPQLKILDVLNTIRTLLAEPHPDNPLEPEVAQIYKNDRNQFNKTAKEWTKKYAK